MGDDPADVDHAMINLRIRRAESFNIVSGPKWPTDQYTLRECEAQLEAVQNKLLFPGDLICAAQGDILDWDGTRLKCGWVVSKLLGRVKFYRAKKEHRSKYFPYSKYLATNMFVEVQQLKETGCVVLHPGERVLIKITFACARYARCYVTHNEQGFAMVGRKYRGIIRADDSGGDLDVRVDEKFSSKDFVIAHWTGEKTGRRWKITVSEPDLGVIVARSPEGNFLLPISDTRMLDPIQRVEYPRKVANPRKRKQNPTEDQIEDLSKSVARSSL